MPQQVRQRTQGDVDYRANQKRDFKLDRGMLYRDIQLSLELGVTGAGTTISGTNIHAGDELAILRSLELMVNGQETIRNFTMEELAWLNLFQYGSAPVCSKLTNTNRLARRTLIIPSWMPQSRVPVETCLPSGDLQDLRLRVSWGDVTSITSAASAALTADPVLKVSSLEAFNLAGDFALHRVDRLVEANVPETSDYKIDLTPGAIFRGILLNTKDASGDDIADAIDNIKVVSGTTSFVDMDAKTMREAYCQRARISNEALDLFTSDGSDYRGWHWIEFVHDGNLNEGIDTVNLSQFSVVLKTNQAVSALVVMPVRIVPVRKVAP